MFPKSVCTSVNNVACHGIPDDRPLADGDIINIDITVSEINAQTFNEIDEQTLNNLFFPQVFFEGFHGDCSKTFLIGNVDALGRHLVKITEECLYKGIEVCGPNVSFKEIGSAVENHANENGLEVIREFIGHGIGTYFHGQPEICHYRKFAQ